MKKWAFVSDFDGTISKKDFYWIVIERYFPEGKELYKEWKNGSIKDIDFLSTVFGAIHQEEDQIIRDVHGIPIDEYVPPFVKAVQQSGGDFYILSAGTDYYIKHIIEKYKLENVVVLSNEGVFKDKNIQLNINKEDWKYSERYGIDKAIVIQKLKEEYEKVYFAGDSEPDSHPAAFADITFARDVLKDLLTEKNIDFIPFESFREIEAQLTKNGQISAK
ncbi:MtnX-like HAD-IB family phosphatase [Niallia taxi]|uniref:2,3-diketo-5-methylthio-1-phosphopentane phosphatase n=1 Tax=Niallia taxi TaxID=2499688 RepID=A0A437KF19_9BACI|nr:MtnX-like HAD-IB family phosphatase [Niallia taxi]MDK8641843.1 MtnX-like HAD-IB family phosphatase [Niallia taxi]RVT65622.1 2,3-diketo-5-methylthio-1-phosphopentane phosphatase [Niallia taxi]